jgi:hypothetical protein
MHDTNPLCTAFNRPPTHTSILPCPTNTTKSRLVCFCLAFSMHTHVSINLRAHVCVQSIQGRFSHHKVRTKEIEHGCCFTRLLLRSTRNKTDNTHVYPARVMDQDLAQDKDKHRPTRLPNSLSLSWWECMSLCSCSILSVCSEDNTCVILHREKREHDRQREVKRALTTHAFLS